MVLGPVMALTCPQIWGERSFPGGSVVKNLPASAGDMSLIPGSGRSPGEGNGTTPAFLPGKSRGQRSLVGCCLWSRTVHMTEHICTQK